MGYKKNKINTQKVLYILKIGLGLLILILFCACKKEEKMYKKEIFGYFDTVHTIISYDKNEEEFEKKVQFYKKNIENYHKLYNIYENYEGINNIKTINDNAGIKEIKVDKKIIELLDESIKWNKEINNKVNISSGNIIDEWSKTKDGIIPLKNKLENLKKCAKIENIEINKEKETVFIKEKCTKINVGAVAKGYAVEKVVESMKKEKMDNFIISAGGNVKVVGKRLVENDKIKDLTRCKKEFCIGITAPIYNNDILDKNNSYKNKNFIAKIVGTDNSIVTTGSYQRYNVINGEIYGHVVDLDELKPKNNFGSVTIITKNSGLADFLSTTLYLLSYEEGKNLVNKLENVEVIWAFNDGTIKYSKNLIENENIFIVK